jgi:hypothetical protein
MNTGTRRWGGCALALAGTFFAGLSGAADAATTRVYFTKGQQLAYVERSLPSGVEPALRSLLAGPPAGYGTRLPARVTASVRGSRIDFTPDLSDHAALAAAPPRSSSPAPIPP